MATPIFFRCCCCIVGLLSRDTAACITPLVLVFGRVGDVDTVSSKAIVAKRFGWFSSCCCESSLESFIADDEVYDVNDRSGGEVKP